MMPSINFRRQLTDMVLMHNRRHDVDDPMAQQLIQQLSDLFIRTMQQTELMTRRQNMRQLNRG